VTRHTRAIKTEENRQARTRALSIEIPNVVVGGREGGKGRGDGILINAGTIETVVVGISCPPEPGGGDKRLDILKALKKKNKKARVAEGGEMIV